MVAWRDVKYYKTLLAEQASEEGGILLAEQDGKLEGVFCFAKGEQLTIREPLCNEKNVLQYAIFHLTNSEQQPVLCLGYGSEDEKPIIMAKVLNRELPCELKTLKVFLNEVV